MRKKLKNGKCEKSGKNGIVVDVRNVNKMFGKSTRKKKECGKDETTRRKKENQILFKGSSHLQDCKRFFNNFT